MIQDNDIQRLVDRARQDTPPVLDVADAVVDSLAARPMTNARLMGIFAVAASLLAVVTLAAALWTTANRRQMMVARDDLLSGGVPSMMATVQP